MHAQQTDNQQVPVTISGPTVAPQPIVIQVLKQSTPGCSRTYPRYKSRVAAILACLQIFLGVISIAVNSALIQLDTYSTHIVGYGIWTPPIWFVAGGFGIVSACTKRMCPIITTMVMSIISAVTIAWYLPVASIGLAEDQNLYDYNYIQKRVCRNVTSSYYGTQEHCTYIYTETKTLDEEWQSVTTLGSILVIVAVLEGIVAIMASALCCGTLCCCAKNHVEQSNVRYVTVNTNQPTLLVPIAGASAPTNNQHQPHAEEKRQLTEPLRAPDYSVSADPPPPYNPDS